MDQITHLDTSYEAYSSESVDGEMAPELGDEQMAVGTLWLGDTDTSSSSGSPSHPAVHGLWDEFVQQDEFVQDDPWSDSASYAGSSSDFETWSSSVPNSLLLYPEALSDSDGSVEEVLHAAETTQTEPAQLPAPSAEAELPAQPLAAAMWRAERAELSDDDALLIAQAMDAGDLQLPPRPEEADPTYAYRLYSEKGWIRRGTGCKGSIDAWRNWGGKKGLKCLPVLAHQRPNSLRHYGADVKLAKRRGKIFCISVRRLPSRLPSGVSQIAHRPFLIGCTQGNELLFHQFVVGVGDQPAARHPDSIIIWQILPHRKSKRPARKPSPAARSQPPSHLFGVSVEPLLQAGSSSDCIHRSNVLNPAAITTVNLGAIPENNLRRLLSKRNRDDEDESALPRRKIKSTCPKRTRTISISTASIAMVVLVAYVATRISLNSSAAEKTIQIGPPAPPGPPVLPWSSVHWEARSGAPACSDNGWIQKHASGCVKDEHDESVVSCSPSAYAARVVVAVVFPPRFHCSAHAGTLALAE
jgi:hypothetical protein